MIGGALAAERFCKGDGLRDRGCSGCGAARIWSAEIQKKRSPNQIALGLLAAKIRSLIEIEARKQSSIKPVFKLLVARFRLVSGENLIKYDMWI